MYEQQRIVTNLPKSQIVQAIREIVGSIEIDRAEIALYRIVQERLSTTQVAAPGDEIMPRAVDFTLREKDEVVKILQGLVQKEYDEINGKQDVVTFLERLLTYAT